MRRGVNMVYIVENNGVYGLTKGQFSATADKGSKSKRGSVNKVDSLDHRVEMALQLGATFVARGFSGDKKQLVPLIKAGIEHRGAAFIDVVSPCVAFNNHAGSKTKSYDYVRETQRRPAPEQHRLHSAVPCGDPRRRRRRVKCWKVIQHDGIDAPPAQARHAMYDPTDRPGPSPTSSSGRLQGNW